MFIRPPPAGRFQILPLRGQNVMNPGHKLRVARATNDLEAVTRFYRDGLGFSVLGSFHDQEGFDGVMLGNEGEQYHLEFTSERGRDAGRAPTLENLLVFYIPDMNEWREIVARMASQGYEAVSPGNPYWDRSGRTFEDPDGYRVVVQNAEWPR